VAVVTQNPLREVYERSGDFSPIMFLAVSNYFLRWSLLVAEPSEDKNRSAVPTAIGRMALSRIERLDLVARSKANTTVISSTRIGCRIHLSYP